MVWTACVPAPAAAYAPARAAGGWRRSVVSTLAPGLCCARRRCALQSGLPLASKERQRTAAYQFTSTHGSCQGAAAVDV